MGEDGATLEHNLGFMGHPALPQEAGCKCINVIKRPEDIVSPADSITREDSLSRAESQGEERELRCTSDVSSMALTYTGKTRPGGDGPTAKRGTETCGRHTMQGTGTRKR